MIKAFISHRLVTAMNLEYDIIIAHKPIEQLLQDISKAEAQFPQSPNVGRVISEFKFKQKIIAQRQSFREDYRRE